MTQVVDDRSKWRQLAHGHAEHVASGGCAQVCVECGGELKQAEQGRRQSRVLLVGQNQTLDRLLRIRTELMRLELARNSEPEDLADERVELRLGSTGHRFYGGGHA
jgi:hypothetical protein